MTDEQKMAAPRRTVLGERMLSIEEVARKLGCSHSTIYNYMDSRNFPQPAKWLGRNFWNECAIDAWLANEFPQAEPSADPQESKE